MQIGDEIGQYVIIEHIGRGGMADVWSAHDEKLERMVAVKTIAANLMDDKSQDLFKQEARMIAALEHSNILPIYDFGEYERQLYIVMRLVPGGSLLDRLIEGPMPDPDVIRIGGAVAAALERAHADRIVHRDLKPANVLLDKFGTPYLADFGLAVVAGASQDENVSAGTLLYMPPEQLYGEAVDQRADIYAFAIMLFQMLTGELPFEAQAALCIRQMQNADDLPDPRQYRADLPEGLTAVLRIATSPQVDARYDSAGLLMSEVATVLEGQPLFAPRRAASGDVAPLQMAPYRAETDPTPREEDFLATMTMADSEEFEPTMDVDSSQMFARMVAGLMTEDEAKNIEVVDALVDAAQFSSEEDAEVLRNVLLESVHVTPDELATRLQENLETVQVNVKAFLAKVRSEAPADDLDDFASTMRIERGDQTKLMAIVDKARGENKEADVVDALMDAATLAPDQDTEAFREDLIMTFRGDTEQLVADLQDHMATVEFNSEAFFDEMSGAGLLGETMPLPKRAAREDEDVTAADEADVVSSPALREAQELYQRMVRAWTQGQRFLTGATYFANIHTFYQNPREYGLKLTDAGRVAMLRGAIEHNYELDFWLAQVPDENMRRQAALYALRSDAPAARALAVRLLQTMPETEPPSVALAVGRLLHSETDRDVRRAVVDLLAAWGEHADTWRDVAFNNDTDLLLAEQTLRTDAPDVAEKAARSIGQMRSLAAVRYITGQQADAPEQVRLALAWIRDEADDIPGEIAPLPLRANAFSRLTSHYLTSNVAELGLRFFTALLGTGIGLGLLVHFTVRTRELSLLRLDHLYRVIGNGQTFGLIAGLGVMLAAAIPLRLAGSAAQRSDGATLWRWWGRLPVAWLVGGLIITIAYLNYQVVALRLTDPAFAVVLLAGLSTALGAAVASTFRLPLWARVPLVAVMTLIPIVLTSRLYFFEQTLDTPLFYFDTYEGLGSQLWTTSIALALLTGLGAYGPEVIQAVRGMTRWPAAWKRYMAMGAAACGALSLVAWFAPVAGIIVSATGLFLATVAREDRWEYRVWVLAGGALSMVGFWLTIFSAIRGPLSPF